MLGSSLSPLSVARVPSRLVLLAALALFARPAPAPAPVRVEFLIGSQQAGSIVAPGTPINWFVFARVLPGDHEGLALFSLDLVQHPENPQTFDLPPGDPAPSTLASFDRPAGFTNPSEDPWGSGYGGTPVGRPGARDLVQIGGAQNVFGQAPPCFGPQADVCMGQDVNVESGIATGPGLTLVASGSFLAPATPGTYALRLANGVANVLDEVNVAPAASKTRAAEVLLGGASLFYFTVQ